MSEEKKVDHLAELKRLRQAIPSYRKGDDFAKINSVYLKARDIILHVANLPQHKQTMSQSLGVSSVDIDNSIEWGRKASTEKLKNQYFKKAALQLEDDIDTAIVLLERDKKNAESKEEN